MLCSRIVGLTLLLGVGACAHQTAPVAPPPSPAQGAAAASQAATGDAGFRAADASTRTFLHQTSASRERRITVMYEDADIHNVIDAFAAFSGRTIIAGRDVRGSVTVEVHDVPWDVALQSILTRQQLVASESEDGTITVRAE